MERIEVKVGIVRTVRGNDESAYRIIEFAGERLGYARTYLDDRQTRGRDVEIYRVEEGRGGFVVHVLVWSMWEGEGDEYTINYYADWGALEADWRPTLEQAGLAPRRRLSLWEWLEEEQA